MDIIPDYLMSFLIGPGDVAFGHRTVYAIIIKGKGHHDTIRTLAFHRREIQGTLSYPRRCPCLQPSHGKTLLSQGGPESYGGPFIEPTARSIVLPNEYPSFHKSAGGQDHHFAGYPMPPFGNDPHKTVSLLIKDDIGHRIHEQL